MLKETKVFDPASGFAPLTNVVELTDSTLALRGDRWWMYLAGQISGSESTHLFSASLPSGAPLSATGWTITPSPNDPAQIALLAGWENSSSWDFPGGRHCPSYVRGWDPHRGTWVERIYYAGSPEQLWGPYTIGFIEWDGDRWVDQVAPVFVADEPWERCSVYEPNVLFHDGKWKLWYVAGSNQDDYLVHGYSESSHGQSNWTPHLVFAPAEWRLFDFHVIRCRNHFEAVFSRVWVGKAPPPETTGLWWCRCDMPSPMFSDWSDPVQILTAADRGWHSGPWRPAARYQETAPGHLLVFFDGLRNTGDLGPFPFAFTLGCLELPQPV
jgi:hypothetical protein